MRSKVVLKESALNRLESIQKMCDKILRDYSVDDIDNDWLLTELDRISASVEAIFENYE